jgi:type VI secretion system secreted protein Hcp
MKSFYTLLTGLFIFHTIANSQSIFMAVEGNVQGKFKGEGSIEREEKMDVAAISMEAVAGGSSTGVASGRRQHQPFFVKKITGAASPQFFQALVTNEVLRRVVIEFSNQNMNGEEAIVYVITLENVRINSFKQVTEIPSNTKSPKNILFDEIKFIYQKITVESKTGKTSAADDIGR